MSNSLIIGRVDELKTLDNCYKSKESQLIIVYGRRRVGKTFLINHAFENKFTFKFTGVYKQSKSVQLINFTNELNRLDGKERKAISDWSSAFNELRSYLDSFTDNQKLIVFFDEMPWLDTPKSGFLSAFDYFWNNYGNNKNNLIFIVAGSASSWISNKLFASKGGFFNRHTARIYLNPFTLKETKEFLLQKNIHYSNYDIAELYMIVGGIPFYLNQISPLYSLNENINNLFFKKNGVLFDEFNRLYSTLFSNDEFYIRIVELLSNHRYGLTIKDIATALKVPTNGTLSNALNNLIYSGFVEKGISYSKRKESIYQLIDFYTMFYFTFLKNKNNDDQYWNNSVDLPKRRAYLGLCFETLVKLHIIQLKKALSIYGISSTHYSYLKKGDNGKKGTQIDLIIDRRDNVIDLCELKFSLNQFEIDKEYYFNLTNKLDAFMDLYPNKSIRIVLVSTYGLRTNMYSNIVNVVINLDDLFKY